MTLSDLISGYHRGSGSLSGDALTGPAGEIWTMMMGESRGRIQEVDPETAEGSLVQQCFDQMLYTAVTEASALRSETLGQWSRTYRDPDRSRNRQMKTVLREYLGETGLLYRGWDGCI